MSAHQRTEDRERAGGKRVWPGLSRPTQHRARRFLLGAGVLAGVLLLGTACEGDNLFEGTEGATRPSITLEVPSQVLAGDTLSVRVDARAPRGLERISLLITGPILKDTTYIVPEGASVASPVFHLRMPELFVDPVLVVSASVRDMAGISSAAADTIVALQRTQ